ncbi:ABC transporter ATP-binding protein [Breznakiella homolactica]|uniref:ABC transporter ATP-binding protein n=1 Tax=Breznakiella homolactica TaxID=2798577 RepID=A0A7T7XLP0_9SPIR|nr:ABC transporter ATP-binding protein [Breznakiella homolactica]QQO08543.1 ABC transporter ATP-binding protein [Breznakiella homolactica]
MSKIELENINKYFGPNHVLKDVNLTIEDGDFMTLLGPSGCGKTTTLRIVAGLEHPDTGTIRLDGKGIVNASDAYFQPPSKRDLNLVFQSYALWPHLTVFKNVAFGLSIKKVPREEIRDRVEQVLERMQILQFRDRYPAELSGGQQQRVAIARAIVTAPKTLLLDEPLSNLDAKLRLDMRSEIKRLHQELGTTIIYVTHDQIEALTMSTKVAVFFEGSLVQVDSPLEIYRNPATLEVADFIGNPRINFVDAQARFTMEKIEVTSCLGSWTYKAEDFTETGFPQNEDFKCILGIRPEQLLLRDSPGEQSTEVTIYTAQPAGSETLVQVQVGDNLILIKELGNRAYEADEKVYMEVDPDSVNIFNEKTGRLLKYAE